MPERNAVASGSQAPLKKFDWPPYLVSSAHTISGDWNSPHARRPYGTWHARKVGDLQTACGVSAVTWPFFWTLRFDPMRPEACPACVAVLRDQVLQRRSV
jgi:hypothetical protein